MPLTLLPTIAIAPSSRPSSRPPPRSASHVMAVSHCLAALHDNKGLDEMVMLGGGEQAPRSGLHRPQRP